MPSHASSTQRLDKARELIREKGLSRPDLDLLEEILRLGPVDLVPMPDPLPEGSLPPTESAPLARLRRSFGVFLAFLNQFSDKRLGEVRPAMGLVLQHSLARLGDLAKASHHDLLHQHQEPDWVVHLLDLIAALRTMSTSLGDEDQLGLLEHWAGFLHEGKDHFRALFHRIGEGENNAELTQRLQHQLKTLNRSLRLHQGRPIEHIRKLEALLEGSLPEDTRRRAEPLLLVQHVIASLRMSLVRPLDQGIHWPAVENVRGSLQWLWNHLGWVLPRVEGQTLLEHIPAQVRSLLKDLRKEHPPIFLVVARALASHLALLSLMEPVEPAAASTVRDRFATVPTFFVLEAELGRLAERVYHPRATEALPKGGEESLLLGAFLRQAVLSLLQDQATVRGLLQQTLASNDVDQLASTLDNLKALLVSHQNHLMSDLVGLFSPELRQRLFPHSPTFTEEGDRLRQRLYRLWEHLDPAVRQLELNLELQDLPRLALGLGQAQNHVSAFRRSPEFLLVRSADRVELDRLTQQFMRALEDPHDIEAALREGTQAAGELLRFLDVFLLRINARVPLIRLDLAAAREGEHLCASLLEGTLQGSERTRIVHLLIQAIKPIGVRDPQALHLLKRWVRAERSGKEAPTAARSLSSHLAHLAARLEAALL